jgi:hypothetical protein
MPNDNFDNFYFKDLIYTSGLNVLFLIDYGFFSKEDLRWNNYTFTWLDNIQPILRNAENRFLKEKDNWITNLRDKRSKLLIKLNDCLNRVRDLKQKERISEAESIVNDLKLMAQEIEEFNKEVS